jgi:glycosyltransferase involved in cell wall biosynthesis
MEIHQILVSASPGDAVTNAAFELRAVLRGFGPSEIFARYYDGSLQGEVRPLHEYAQRSAHRPEADILLYHCSIGEADVFCFVIERPERLVLVYHNIAPAPAFEPHDSAFARLLEDGRRQLAALAPRTEMALADSEYNAAELRALGYRDVRVAPLILGYEQLLRAVPDEATTHHLRAATAGPLVLSVGQLLPHKRPDLVVQAYHVLVTYLLPDAHLALVGPARLPRYRRALQTFVYELNLAYAWITGPVSDAELVAFYRRADVFVSASEHEGFGVPLVEAMAFGVPIVTQASAAIPETIGNAGIVLPPIGDPVLLAEAVAEVLTDLSLAERLRRRGTERLERFSPDKARSLFLALLSKIA